MEEIWPRGGRKSGRVLYPDNIGERTISEPVVISRLKDMFYCHHLSSSPNPHQPQGEEKVAKKQTWFNLDSSLSTTSIASCQQVLLASLAEHLSSLVHLLPCLCAATILLQANGSCHLAEAVAPAPHTLPCSLCNTAPSVLLPVTPPLSSALSGS